MRRPAYARRRGGARPDRTQGAPVRICDQGLLDDFDLDTAEGRSPRSTLPRSSSPNQGRGAAQGVRGRSGPVAGAETIQSSSSAGSPGTCLVAPRERRGSKRATRPDDTRETGNGHHGPFSQKNQDQPYDLGDPVVQLERQVLQLAVQRPGLCGPEFDSLGADAFTASAHRAVFTLIAACGGTAAGGGSGRAWAARLREEAPNERAQAFVTGLAVEPLEIAGEPDAKYADVVLARVGELAVSREITHGQGPAAAHESGGRAGGIQQDVRRSGRSGDPPAGPARPGRGRLRRRCGVIIRLRIVRVSSAGVTKLGPP